MTQKRTTKYTIDRQYESPTSIESFTLRTSTSVHSLLETALRNQLENEAIFYPDFPTPVLTVTPEYHKFVEWLGLWTLGCTCSGPCSGHDKYNRVSGIIYNIGCSSLIERITHVDSLGCDNSGTQPFRDNKLVWWLYTGPLGNPFSRFFGWVYDTLGGSFTG